MEILIQLLGTVATVASVIFAVVTWKDAQTREALTKKQDYTADFLAHSLTNECLAEPAQLMALLIGKGKPLTSEMLSLEDQRKIIHLLNYYEYVCIFYYRGVLDEKLVIELRAGTMKRAFQICKPFIMEIRENVNPSIFQALLEFYRDPNTEPMPLGETQRAHLTEAEQKYEHWLQTQSAREAAP